jgi:hypothetical protein
MSAEKIRALNDAFRSTMSGGRVMMTAGVDALPSDVKAMVIRRVATFSEFTPDNDPHGEHDFGSFELGATRTMTRVGMLIGRRSNLASAFDNMRALSSFHSTIIRAPARCSCFPWCVANFVSQGSKGRFGGHLHDIAPDRAGLQTLWVSRE